MTYARTIYTLLGMLNIKPMTGYEIKKTLRQTVNEFWSESDGQIYPGLKKCLQEGLAETLSVQNQPNTLTKVTYGITTKGKDVLNEWLLDPNNKRSHRDESLLKLTLSDKANTPTITQLLNQRIDKALSELNRLSKTHTIPEETTDNLGFLQAIFSRSKMMLEAEINWATACLTELEASTPN